ncbi:MAG: DNA-binding transcriptional regulator Fis [Candidatus Endonucleobacter sp. (ex Gigantidas childressi)]|nr:DNA-binding transcriptional regulator Fis [Candidatus Endonucleobacter sp. (ex Gigantidas childressi)]
MSELPVIAEKKSLKNCHNCLRLESHQATDTQTLRDSVERAMNNYFSHLDGQDATNVYEMVLSEVEAPLLETIMSYVQGNQSKAATLLGLNRGTLRKKLKQYGLI